MKKRNWKGHEKLQIVLEGLKGHTPLGELCNHHEISQSQYYKWREQLLKHGSKLFEFGGPSKEEDRLRRENQRLKSAVGELTMELKKIDEVW